MHWPHIFLLSLLSLSLGGCSASHRLGGLDGAGESCGNGMDDDGDREIDEGCFCVLDERQSCFSGTYPHRLIGQCADGNQACETSADEEFGAWGACEGDVLPDMEVCEGSVDEDCDGSVDEGCPCPAAGETRECGAEFNTFPCHRGRQTCALSGFWSGCEGAVGPGPELCSDSLDNDCDGTINEGCECLPAPETCGDGIDNDCDGLVDELACSGGSTAACEGSWQVINEVPQSLANANQVFSTQRSQITLHDDVVAILYIESASPGQPTQLSLRGLDGRVIADTIVDPESRPGVFRGASIVGDGDGFWVSYSWQIDPGVGAGIARVARVRMDGSLELTPVDIAEGRALGGALVAGVRHLVYSDAAGVLHSQRLDDSLQPQGPDTDLGPGVLPGLQQGNSPIRVRALGDSLGILSIDAAQSSIRLRIVRGDALVLDEVVHTIDTATGEQAPNVVELVSDGSSYLACWSTQHTGVGYTGCRRGRLSDGQLTSPVFPAPAPTVAPSPCGYLFQTGIGVIEVHRLLDDNSYESSTAGWSYGTFNHAAFWRQSGGLVLVERALESSTNPHVSAGIFTLRSGEARSGGDCALARQRTCEALAECCGTGSCAVHTRGSFVSTESQAVSVADCNLPEPFCIEQDEAGCTAAAIAGDFQCAPWTDIGSEHIFFPPAACRLPSASVDPQAGP